MVKKVFLATAGVYSDYRVAAVFTNRQDAENYELAERVEEYELHDAPIEVRTWHTLWWRPDEPDYTERWGNPHEGSIRADYDGRPHHVTHQWHTYPAGGHCLAVSGWDLAAVRKVYSEQRAEYENTHGVKGQDR